MAAASKTFKLIFGLVFFSSSVESFVFGGQLRIILHEILFICIEKHSEKVKQGASVCCVANERVCVCVHFENCSYILVREITHKMQSLFDNVNRTARARHQQNGTEQIECSLAARQSNKDGMCKIRLR